MQGRAIIQATAALVLLGVTAGLGTAVYRGTHDEAVTRAVARHESREKQLEQEWDTRRIELENLHARKQAQASSNVQKTLLTVSNDYHAKFIAGSNDFLVQLLKERETFTNSMKINEEVFYKRLTEMSNILAQGQTMNSNREADLARWRAELEHRFLGTLPTLTFIPEKTNTVSTLEKEVLIKKLIGEKNLRGAEFYSLPISEGVHLSAKTTSESTYQAVPFIMNNTAQARLESTTNTYLLLVRTDRSRTNPFSFHLYQTMNPTNLTDTLAKARPVTELFFDRGIVIADYTAGELIRSGEDQQNYTAREGNVLYSWRKNAEQRLQEFRTLYERGPFGFQTNNPAQDPH
ncbi:hypothetical protein HYZ97_02835 [Candidatus Pacearchaeota archaeon]|nr:hypothetical protein [Candidatus Pacearchaeota archaeon]